MKMLSAQQIFNKSARLLMKQRRKCVADGMCVMRSKSGKLACAVGCLIKPGVYEEQVGDDISSYESQLHLSGVDTFIHRYILSDLQFVHDATPVRKWAGELRTVAADHGLKLIPELKEKAHA